MRERLLEDRQNVGWKDTERPLERERGDGER